MILCSNPHAQYLSQKVLIDKAIARVLKSGRYILGQEVRDFEKEFADYIGVSFGIGVGSGTEALHLALVACGIKDGDEVIAVSNTAVATIAGIELAGGKPVFADVDPEYYLLDTTKLEKTITKKTRAIVAVHLYGHPVEMESLMDIARNYELRVIEDCAQAHGALYKGERVGSFGDMSCFSFYPTKNLGAIGDGGMVLANNADLAEKARLLREYGWKERNKSILSGWNTRLDEIQAAVLRVKLKVLDEQNRRRIEIAEFYNRELRHLNLVLPTKMESVSHVYHLYVIRCMQRDKLLKHLNDNGIAAMIHYPFPVHCQPAYKEKCGFYNLPITEKIAGEILSLPIYPELTDEQAQHVVNTIRTFDGGNL